MFTSDGSGLILIVQICFLCFRSKNIQFHDILAMSVYCVFVMRFGYDSDACGKRLLHALVTFRILSGFCFSNQQLLFRSENKTIISYIGLCE